MSSQWACERRNDDIVKCPRYSIRSLLIFTSLSAVAISFATWLDGEVYLPLVLAVFCAVAGYVVGWISRAGYERGPNAFISASAFIAFNWLFWCINRIALFFVWNATDRDLSPILSSMAKADRMHCFDVWAGLITVVMICAALRQDRRWLFVSGAACVLIWVILSAVGYLSASMCLIDMC